MKLYHDEKDMNEFLNIAEKFRMNGKPSSCERIGSGHINDSYCVQSTGEQPGSFMLQRINHAIFKDIPSLTENILKVTTHISRKIHSGEAGDFFHDLRLIPAFDGNYFHKDGDGNYWRMFNFIEGSRSFDVVPTPELAYEGGKAFGIFLNLTSDLDAGSLFETIKDFHNIEVRLATFRMVCSKDPFNRTNQVREEIGFIEQRADEMHTILRLGRSGQIPVRVTHNDTKFNNILFDGNNKAVCIVDLDTVMPGFILYDFGDAIRTGANTGAEDEAELEKVSINLELFRNYSKGFLETAGNSLTMAETEHLAFSAKFMTFIIGLRFLTDFLNGDSYYKIQFPGHNLQRSRAQFKLLMSMEEDASSMKKIISDLCK